MHNVFLNVIRQLSIFIPYNRISSNGKKSYLLSKYELFVITYVCEIDEFVPAGSRIISRKIPVARMIGTSLMQTFHALIKNFHRTFHIGRRQQLFHLLRNLLSGKRFVYFFDIIDISLLSFSFLFLAFPLLFHDDIYLDILLLYFDMLLNGIQELLDQSSYEI